MRLTTNREFFEIEPWDAYDVLESMAIIHDRKDKLFRNKENVFFNDPEKVVMKEDYSENSLFPENSYIEKLFNIVKKIALDLYPDLNVVPTKNYVSFKKGRKHNVIAIWPKENSLEIVLNAKLGTILDENELIYDISNRLWTSAQYALRFDETTNIENVKNLIKQTYKQVK